MGAIGVGIVMLDCIVPLSPPVVLPTRRKFEAEAAGVDFGVDFAGGFAVEFADDLGLPVGAGVGVG